MTRLNAASVIKAATSSVASATQSVAGTVVQAAKSTGELAGAARRIYTGETVEEALARVQGENEKANAEKNPTTSSSSSRFQALLKSTANGITDAKDSAANGAGGMDLSKLMPLLMAGAGGGGAGSQQASAGQKAPQSSQGPNTPSPSQGVTNPGGGGPCQGGLCNKVPTPSTNPAKTKENTPAPNQDSGWGNFFTTITGGISKFMGLT